MASSSIRAISMALPRVSMTRIPVVAFANYSPAATIVHQTSAHPSGYSSMPSHKETTTRKSQPPGKNYLHEVKRYESLEDEVLMDLGLAMSRKSQGRQSVGGHTHNHSGGKGDQPHQQLHLGKNRGKTNPKLDLDSYMEVELERTTATFEQTVVDQVKADVIHPSAKNTHPGSGHVRHELASTLGQELKTEDQKSNLSHFAADAIRMAESDKSVLKQDKAKIHDVREEDPSIKPDPSQRS
ncbi:hypothetical protein BGW38_007622 [Lunasporangiospora selenospora]|uniref:Uncharacterized protein n=1 Tax=Lunasporangiospora selenospora TaxID=979761 RepID=A0A9P6FZK3_9FUNG|nr:hypothetical protein BGW38_007622 [Lunasporangiospora selenospora]